MDVAIGLDWAVSSHLNHADGPQDDFYRTSLGRPFSLVRPNSPILPLFTGPSWQDLPMIKRGCRPAVFMSFALAACSFAEQEWKGTISDSAGVTIVSNPDEGIWAPGEEWILTEELRIGGVEGDMDYLFGDIWDVAVDSHGRVFVLDFQAQHIQVYSPEGVYQQTIGRLGEGPGEFRGAVSLLMGPGDTLLVQDNRLFRINRFTPDGSSGGSYLIQLDDRHPQAFKATASGVIGEQFQFPDSPGQPTVVSPMDGIALVTTGGAILDTLLAYPSMASRGVHIYAPVMAWALGEDSQLVCGVGDEYRLEVHYNHRLQRIIVRPFEPDPVSEEEKESILRSREEGAREAGAPPEWIARIRSNVRINDFVPAFQRLEIGPLGTIWVQRVRRLPDPSTEDNSPVWDVFDSEGRFLGPVTMPDRFVPSVFRGGKIYGIWSDDLGVDYLLRFGLASSPGTMIDQ